MARLARVVVAEDDCDPGRLMRATLKMHGFDAWLEQDPEGCLETVEKLGRDVDVVVINGRMASDRNAMLIIKIKRANKHILVLVVAERNQAEVKTRVMDYGADEFVLKPISADTFAAKVQALIIEDRPVTTTMAPSSSSPDQRA